MKIRILTPTPVPGALLPPDCVPDLPEAMAEALVAQGLADSHPDAVAYAEGLGVPVPDLSEIKAEGATPDFRKMTAVEIVAWAREHVSPDFEPETMKKAEVIAAVEALLAQEA